MKIMKKFRKSKENSYFKDNIWGADLADKQLISKYNKRIGFVLRVIDTYTKYAWVVPLKEKMVLKLIMHFKQFLTNLIPNQTKYG